MRHVPFRRGFQPRNVLLFTLTASLLFTSCQRQNNTAAPAAGALPVSVLTVQTESVTLTQELPGRLSAYRIAEVRARISGIVHKRLFEEGADVKEGDVLFEIDPAPYQAALDSARATLARAEASVAAASAQAERFKALVANNAISKQNYDDAVAAHLAAQADVAAAKAAIRTAEINLGYTRASRRRSPAASAAPKSPKAPTCNKAPPRFSPSSSNSIRSTSTSASPPTRCSI